MDIDGVAVIFHYKNCTQAAKGNDKCSQDIFPAEATKLSADDVKAYDEIIVMPTNVCVYKERNKLSCIILSLGLVGKDMHHEVSEIAHIAHIATG